MPITILAVVVVLALTKGIPQFKDEPVESDAGQSQTAFGGTKSDAPATEVTTGSTGSAATGQSTSDTDRAQSQQPIELTSETLTAGHPWLAYLIFSTTLAMLGLLVLARTTVEREADVSDRPEFLRALAICNEAIFAANPTPRGVKRFQNRLRYFAMRTRGDDHDPDWVDRVYARFGHEVGTSRVTREGIDIPEATLVGLGTIHAYGEHGEVAPQFDEVWKSLANGNPNGEIPEDLDKQLHTLEDNFPDKWPPSSDQVKIFAALSQTIET